MTHYFRKTARSFRAVLWTASIIVSSAAAAEDADNNANILTLAGAPLQDRLIIDQSVEGGHKAQVTLEAENAILLGDQWARNTLSTLRPGRVTQTGSDHILTASFAGEGHQLAVRQTGRSHSATVRSQGHSNMVSVAQAGRGNIAGITQAGTRNSVAISQNSW